MTGDISITLQDFSNFLLTGSILRHEGRWHLYSGDFSSSNSSNLQDLLVFLPTFFDVHEGLCLECGKINVLQDDEFRRYLQDILAIQGGDLSQMTFGADSKGADPLVWQAADFGDFSLCFQEIKKRISQGQLDKAVPVIFETTRWIPSVRSRAQFLLGLAAEAPANLWVYGYWYKGEGLLGASPEILYSVEGGAAGSQLRTMALAGTRPRWPDEENSTTDGSLELLKDKKELQEHFLVVSDLEEQLSVLGLVEVGAPQVERLPMLYHLKTEMRVQLFNSVISPLEITQKLHPTAALGVAPRKYGCLWMKDLPQQAQRGHFGAPLTFRLGPNKYVSVVAIRCMQWDQGGSRIGSGCGIIEASEIEKEWQELQYKRNSVKRLLWPHLIEH